MFLESGIVVEVGVIDEDLDGSGEHGMVESVAPVEQVTFICQVQSGASQDSTSYLECKLVAFPRRPEAHTRL